MPEVDSSHIKEAEYKDGIFTVTFLNGRTYKYHKVYPESYQAFLSAPSKGKFLARFIKRYKKGIEVK